MIAIVDIGVGNLGAIKNMLRKVGTESEITGDAKRIMDADKVILPGVGAFDAAMERLGDSGLTDCLNEKALTKKSPILGICLGAQMLGRGSEEGNLPGLGWIAMDAVRFPRNADLRVPHMGWNRLRPEGAHPLFSGAEADIRFYFAHSFYLQCDDDADVIGTTDHGAPFAAAVAHGNIWGAQFHPEKSHRFGAAVLKNFAEHA